MGGWTGCPASAGSLPRPLGERTRRASSALKAGSFRTLWMLPTEAPYVSVWKKTSIKKTTVKRGMMGGLSGGGWGVEQRGRSRSKQQWLWLNCNTESCQSQCLLCWSPDRGKKKKHNENLRRAAVQPIYLSKKSGPIISIQMTALHCCVPQLKLTRGSNVLWQQQTQRSERWGAEAASTAWLNGAGDFPSPPLPSRHSQSLLGKSGAPVSKPGSRRVEGLEWEQESIWDHALFTCTATALRPPQREGLRFHQRRLVSNLLLMATLHPILFPDLLDSIIVSIIKAISSKVRANEWNISKQNAWGCFFHWNLWDLGLITQIIYNVILLQKWKIWWNCIFTVNARQNLKPYVQIINHVKGMFPC